MTFTDAQKRALLWLPRCGLWATDAGCIAEIAGDFADLISHPLLVAEERTRETGPDGPLDESNTWTFYTFRSIGGSVDVRWHGSSNGWYSESVDFTFTPAEELRP